MKCSYGINTHEGFIKVDNNSSITTTIKTQRCLILKLHLLRKQPVNGDIRK